MHDGATPFISSPCPHFVRGLTPCNGSAQLLSLVRKLPSLFPSSHRSDRHPPRRRPLSSLCSGACALNNNYTRAMVNHQSLFPSSSAQVLCTRVPRSFGEENDLSSSRGGVWATNPDHQTEVMLIFWVGHHWLLAGCK